MDPEVKGLSKFRPQFMRFFESSPNSNRGIDASWVQFRGSAFNEGYLPYGKGFTSVLSSREKPKLPQTFAKPLPARQPRTLHENHSAFPMQSSICSIRTLI